MVLAAGVIMFAGWGVTHETRAAKAYTPNNLLRQTQEAVPAEKITSVSAEDVLRLHVRGNSNDKADQDVKLEVRDVIMAGFGAVLSGAVDVKEAERLLEASLGEIERVAVDCLRARGFTYGARAAVKTERFPDRSYESASGEIIFLPEGSYRALMVELGSGKGDNWWCVMYPPLCYFDLAQRAVLKYGGASPGDALQVALIVDELSTKEVPVQVRSLLLDSIRSGLRRLSSLFRN